MIRKIVLDSDGVLLNFGQNYINFAETVLARKINYNLAKYPLGDLLDISKKESDYVWEKFNSTNQWEKIPPLKDVDKALEILKSYDLEIYIVTSIDDKHKIARKKNLNSIGLFPKEIVCVNSNHGHKNKVITEIKPFAFVDDRLDHLYRSQDVPHLCWIDQNQEQIMQFNDYNSRTQSLYEWTTDYLPTIINSELSKKIIKSNHVRGIK